MPTTQRRPTTRFDDTRIDARLLLVFSAVAFSSAGLFTRGSSADLVTLIVWRNVFGAAALVPLILRAGAAQARSDIAALGRWGWATILASSFATLCFLAALRRTTVADVSVIYASAPLVTALIAWIGLRERPARRTLLAAGLATVGMIVTVGGATGAGTIDGDVLALLMTLSIAAMTVLARRHGRPPAMLVACLSATLAALLALPLAWWSGATLVVGAGQLGWLAAFGVVAMGIALPSYLAGAARLPAATAMLLSTLEMPLGPLWVWLAVGEQPALSSLLGGGLIALAVGWDLLA